MWVHSRKYISYIVVFSFWSTFYDWSILYPVSIAFPSQSIKHYLIIPTWFGGICQEWLLGKTQDPATLPFALLFERFSASRDEENPDQFEDPDRTAGVQNFWRFGRIDANFGESWSWWEDVPGIKWRPANLCWICKNFQVLKGGQLLYKCFFVWWRSWATSNWITGVLGRLDWSHEPSSWWAPWGTPWIDSTGRIFRLSHSAPVQPPIDTTLVLDVSFLDRHEVVLAEKIYNHCDLKGSCHGTLDFWILIENPVLKPWEFHGISTSHCFPFKLIQVCLLFSSLPLLTYLTVW